MEMWSNHGILVVPSIIIYHKTYFANQCGKCGKQSTPTYHKSAFAHQVWEATHAHLKYVSIYIIYSRIHARPFFNRSLSVREPWLCSAARAPVHLSPRAPPARLEMKVLRQSGRNALSMASPHSLQRVVSRSTGPLWKQATQYSFSSCKCFRHHDWMRRAARLSACQMSCSFPRMVSSLSSSLFSFCHFARRRQSRRPAHHWERNALGRHSGFFNFSSRAAL